MNLRTNVIKSLAGALCLLAPAAKGNALGANAAQMPPQTREFFKEYCVECHGADKQKGKVRLDDVSLSVDTLKRADGWAKILNALNSGDMPPEDAKQPANQAKADFLETLSQTMVVARKALSDQGGNITMRRLNRREYQNSLRELLGVEVNVGALPVDGSSESFDTVGTALFVSADQFMLYRQLGRKALDSGFEAALQETKFRKAHFEAEAETVPMVERSMAEFVSIRKRYTKWTRAVDAVARLPENATAAGVLREKNKDKPERFYLEWDKIPGAPAPKEFGFPDAVDANMMNGRWDSYVPQAADYLARPKSKTGTFLGVAHLNHRWVTVPVPADWPAGEYKVRARLAAPEEGPTERRFVDFLSDYPASQVLNTHQVTGTMDEPQLLEIPIIVEKEGGRRFKFAEKAVLGNPDGKGTAGQVFNAGFQENRIGPEYAVWVDWVEVEGPFVPERVASVRAWLRGEIEQFERNPADPRRFIAEFGARALRGHSVEVEFLDMLCGLYATKLADGEKPLDALKTPLSLLLASPSFLYMAEPAEHGKPRGLNDLELATRLSFFLWSTPPDAELLALAGRGELQKQEVLAGQVERLLADARSERFLKPFVLQWLGLARLEFFQFNTKLYPDFDLPTKAAAKDEVVNTFIHLLRKRESLAKLLKSDAVFINGLLATYYKIPGVVGDEFREVSLTSDSPRGGLLGMAAILAMGSNGEQTSPVERGAWVLRKLLHDPPPPAPANVPQLNRLAEKALTTRERIALHQEDAQCAQCHRKIDPLGFGLENFDAAGRWRTVDLRPGVPPENRDINPSGVLYKGAAFGSFQELRDLVAAKPERFARGFSEALIEYGLGRPFGFSDEELCNEVVGKAAQKSFSIPEFIQALVASKAFHSK
jgi:mono/diheme cytochrome c family protein